MANLQRLLRRRPDIQDDPELQARVRARLASIQDPFGASRVAEPPEPDEAPEAGIAAGPGDSAEAADSEEARDSAEAGNAAVPGDSAGAGDSAEARDVADVRGGDEPSLHDDEPVGDGDETSPAVPAAADADVLEPIPVPSRATRADMAAFDLAASVTGVATVEGAIEIVVAPSPSIGETVLPTPAPRAPERAARPPRSSRPDRARGARDSVKRRPRAAGPVVSCPYCASVLQPPPVASRRCPRCRQKIVVRRLADRAVYLTEAAVPIFEAERRRMANAGRWTTERDRWLDLALTSGAAGDRAARLIREPIAEGVVAAARTLYLATVDRSVRSARLERRWEEAARIRFAQAQALYRLAGSPASLPDDVVRIHRDGIAAALHGIGEVSKSAELRAGSCCGTCQAEDGQMVRIAGELRSPRLPHPSCPKGLCRCRWYLADRDRAIVTTMLKRQSRVHRHSAGTRT